MYGICHKGVELFLQETYGEEAWQKAKTMARIDGEVQLDAYYEDSLNTRLFEAILDQFPEQDMDVLLFDFGKYWVKYARDTELRALLSDSDDFLGMLDSLNDMHARMKLLLPQMRPPVFDVVRISDNEAELHYRSEREGLAPMVVGLIEELGTTYALATEISQTAEKVDGKGHDVFRIKHYAKNLELTVAAE